MKLPTELLLLLVLPPATSFPLHQRSLSFPSLLGLTHLKHDYSSAESFSHPTKFFHESTFSPHYDGRFASTELPHHTRLFHLRLMLKAYTDTMERIRVRTWLMHGCLLGWWWNARIMPWDADIDFMVDEGGIRELGGWWNMSVHHFTGVELGVDDTSNQDDGSRDNWGRSKESDISAGNERLGRRMLAEEVRKTGKKYLLEINPHYTNTSTRDTENVIDARWIDTATGLFIDITTVHVQPIPPISQSHPTTPSTDSELYTKDQHAYTHTQIFPLRSTTFEALPVHVPFDYEELLLDEYGAGAITQRWFRGWRFDVERHEWVLDGGEEGDEEKVLERWGREREKADYLVRVGEKKKGGKSMVGDIA